WLAYLEGKDLEMLYQSSKMPNCNNIGLKQLVNKTYKLFFTYCIGRLSSMPLMTRLYLASLYLNDAHS
ncbi:hypothetical protein DER46DRAFT_508032, partial [Fusarium sp. MPI-SDFR-AT-0072]